MNTLRRVLIFLLLVFLFFSLTKNIVDYRKTLEFYQSFKTAYEKTKHENTKLHTEVLRNRDQNQIEKTIRDQLNLLKSDEVAVIIPDPTPTPARLTPTPAPVYIQWFRTFFPN